MMFVRVLASGTGSTKPTPSEIVVTALIAVGRTFLAEKNGAGHRARMNTPAFFCLWYSLDTMAASFVAEARNIGRANCHQCVGDRDLVLSTLTVEIFRIRLRQILHKQFGVLPAFAGPEFDLHVQSSVPENPGTVFIY